jgi:hypothetical protein
VGDGGDSISAWCPDQVECPVPKIGENLQMSTDEKPDSWGNIKWVVGIVIALFTIVVFFDPFGWRAPKLVPVPQPHPQQLTPSDPLYVPFGNQKPTVVPLRNVRQNEALVQGATFTITSPKKATPQREPLAGKGPTLPVFFTARHYDQRSGQFNMVFPNLPAAPGKDEHTVLEVAVVEPAWLGTTLVGTLRVFYSDNQFVDVKGVELDVLADMPMEPAN